MPDIVAEAAARGGGAFSRHCAGAGAVCITIQLSAQRATDRPRTITDGLNDSHASDTHQTHFLPSGGRPRGNTQERGARDPGKVAVAENRSGREEAVVKGVRISGVGGHATRPPPPAAAGTPGFPRAPSRPPAPGPALRSRSAFLDAESPSSPGVGRCQTFPNFPKLPLRSRHPAHCSRLPGSHRPPAPQTL